MTGLGYICPSFCMDEPFSFKIKGSDALGRSEKWRCLCWLPLDLSVGSARNQENSLWGLGKGKSRQLHLFCVCRGEDNPILPKNIFHMRNSNHCSEIKVGGFVEGHLRSLDKKISPTLLGPSCVSCVSFLAGKEQSMAFLRHTPLFWIWWNMQPQPLEGFELGF